jgi:hypothetical protein
VFWTVLSAQVASCGFVRKISKIIFVCEGNHEASSVPEMYDVVFNK